MQTQTIKIIGAGLAGCECAYQLAKRGVNVELFEMRPKLRSEAHKTDNLCELVCSNSLKSVDINTSQGLLKYELEKLDSMVLACAFRSRVPSGGALAVDRRIFSALIEEELSHFANLKIIREERTKIEPFTVISAGPLASDALAKEISGIIGNEYLYFFDAAAPIVTADSIDTKCTFRAGRYNKGGEDYINCPLNKEEYYEFVDNLINADTIEVRGFEKKFFSACSPVEQIAKSGINSLRFGPLRPVGLKDAEGKRPFAVVQLRVEDGAESCYNMVGFQTNLTFNEQRRVFSMIPALKNAEFVRYGVMHRNTFLNSPKVLNLDGSLKSDNTVFFAGQITGGEGYAESIMSGLMCGINAARRLENKEAIIPPETTMTGSLMRYLVTENKNFQPMHVSYLLTPKLENAPRDKQKKKEEYSIRARADFDKWLTLTEVMP